MYNINRMIANGEVTREEANSGDNQAVTDELSQSNRMVRLVMMMVMVDTDVLGRKLLPLLFMSMINTKQEMLLQPV